MFILFLAWVALTNVHLANHPSYLEPWATLEVCTRLCDDDEFFFEFAIKNNEYWMGEKVISSKSIRSFVEYNHYKTPKLAVRISVDDSSDYEHLIYAMHQIREAGVYDIVIRGPTHNKKGLGTALPRPQP